MTSAGGKDESSAAKKGRKAILDYLQKHIGKPVHTHTLKQVSGNQSEYARRIRELRNEFGYKILTINDDDSIKARYYVLKSKNPVPKSYKFERKISENMRFRILERNGFTCQTCGLGVGDKYPGTSKEVKLQIGHAKDKSSGGGDNEANLFAQCIQCNHGASNITPSFSKYTSILALIRKADRNTQIRVLKWLKEKFENKDAGGKSLRKTSANSSK